MTSTVLRTLAVGQREWIPSCLASLQISLETDENGGTSSGYFLTGLLSFTIQLRSGWTKQQLYLERIWGSGPESQRDGQSVVHESGTKNKRNKQLNEKKKGKWENKKRSHVCREPKRHTTSQTHKHFETFHRQPSEWARWTTMASTATAAQCKVLWLHCVERSEPVRLGCVLERSEGSWAIAKFSSRAL